MKHRLAILSVILLMANGMRAETQLADTLREVVVTGARSETDVRLLPLAVSVVDEKMLTEKPEPNILPTLVENVPGLFVTERGVLGYSVSTGGSGAIKVRGIGGSPIRMYWYSLTDCLSTDLERLMGNTQSGEPLSAEI